MTRIPIKIDKGWMPDFPADEVGQMGGLVKATNILPVTGAYYPVKDKVIYLPYFPTSLSGGIPVKGACFQSLANENHYNILATTRHLYGFDKSGARMLTRETISPFQQYTGVSWDFAQYGNWIIATNLADEVQVLKSIDNPTLRFVNIGSAKCPRAKYCLVDHGYLILAYLSYNSQLYYNQIMWSGQELPESWDYDNPTHLDTGADVQDFPDMDGVITGLAKVGAGWAIFAENSITTAVFSGGSYTFSFNNNVVKNVGCFYPGSLISIGELVFFWSRDSIWEFSQSGVREIGQNIKRTLFGSLDTSSSLKIQAIPDLSRNMIHWIYVTNSSLYPNMVLNYNYLDGRFTQTEISCYAAMRGITGGTVSDQLNSANGYPNIDNLHYIIDSLNAGSQFETIIFDTDGYIKNLSGNILKADIQTGEFGDVETVTELGKAYIPIEGNVSGSVIPKHRYSTMASQITEQPSPIKPDGTVDLRVNDRRHSLDISLTDFSRIGLSLQVDSRTTGRR